MVGLFLPLQARARWHSQRCAPAFENATGSANPAGDGGDARDNIRARPADQSAIASAAAVADRPWAVQSEGTAVDVARSPSSPGGSVGATADVVASRSSADQSAAAGAPAGRRLAGQTGTTVVDVVASKPSPKRASASGRIRQPLFGGENTRGVDTAAASAAVVGFDKTIAFVSASANSGAPGRADASFVGPVNPREALHASEVEGEKQDEGGYEDVTWADAGEDMGMQRRLTFGHGKVEAAAREAAAAAAADTAAAAAVTATTAEVNAAAAAAASATNTIAGGGESGQVSRQSISMLFAFVR